MLARGLFDELKRGRGSVVNVTSIAGGRVHPFAGAAYSCSKAALAALTREMAADFGPDGAAIIPELYQEIGERLLPGTQYLLQYSALEQSGFARGAALLVLKDYLTAL